MVAKQHCGADVQYSTTKWLLGNLATHRGCPSRSCITTACLLKSTGAGTGNPRSCNAWKEKKGAICDSVGDSAENRVEEDAF